MNIARASRCLRRPVGLPLFDGFLRQFPLFESFDDPVQVVVFRFELSDGIGGVGRDEFLLAGFIQDRNLQMPVGAWRHILLKLIHNLQIFVGQFEDRAPDFFTRGWSDAGESATPLCRPPAELDGVIAQRRQIQELMFRRPALELGEIEIVSVQKDFLAGRSW